MLTDPEVGERLTGTVAAIDDQKRIVTYDVRYIQEVSLSEQLARGFASGVTKEQAENEKIEKAEALIKASKDKFNTQEAKATTLESGLKYYISEKGLGEKVKEGDIIGAQFKNMGKSHTAILFENKLGQKNYYTTIDLTTPLSANQNWTTESFAVESCS